LLAEGNTLLVNVPEEQFDLTMLENLGWQIYQDGNEKHANFAAGVRASGRARNLGV
jgi:hypothetical protein